MINIPSAYSPQIDKRFSAANDNPSGAAAPGDFQPIGNAGQQQDTVTLSGKGRDLSAQNSTNVNKTKGEPSTDLQTKATQKDQAQKSTDLALIQQLKKRDNDVRNHEQAHLAVAGRYATGGASYTYQTGPDGVRYAIGGEVPISISAESTPDATIQKMEAVRRAALAPADPSPADLQIAAEASALEIQAMQEEQVIQREKANPPASSPGSGTSPNSNTQSKFATSLSFASTTIAATSGQISPDNNRQRIIQTYQAMIAIT